MDEDVVDLATVVMAVGRNERQRVVRGRRSEGVWGRRAPTTGLESMHEARSRGAVDEGGRCGLKVPAAHPVGCSDRHQCQGSNLSSERDPGWLNL